MATEPTRTDYSKLENIGQLVPRGDTERRHLNADIRHSQEDPEGGYKGEGPKHERGEQLANWVLEHGLTITRRQLNHIMQGPHGPLITR